MISKISSLEFNHIAKSGKSGPEPAGTESSTAKSPQDRFCKASPLTGIYSRPQTQESPQSRRVGKLRAQMAKQGLDGVLITDPFNFRYFSGFTGDAGMLLITPEARLLFTDSRFWEQARQEAPEFDLVKNPAYGELNKHFKSGGKLGFEEKTLSVQSFENLKAALKADFKPVSSAIDDLRMIKDPEEISLLEKSIALNDRVFETVAPRIKPGASEKAVRAEIHYDLEKGGAQGPSFPAIVGAGANGALPHHTPDATKIQEGDLVVVDMGGNREGYCSDLTRTVMVGEVPEKAKEIYRVVAEAQQKAFDKIAPGVPIAEVDKAARDHIAKAGYGEYFGHSLGHGVGLEIHEAPAIYSRSQQKLEPGMVFTVEPGIYLPGFGGVRIEDVVVITKDGYRILSHAKKQKPKTNKAARRN